MRRIWTRAVILWRWLPVIWGDFDWDHAFLWRVLGHKFRRMAAYAERHGHGQSSKRQALELCVAEVLCRRLCRDDYDKDETAQQDLDYLCRLIQRKGLTWWD